jgi:hypothetical protein
VGEVICVHLLARALSWEKLAAEWARIRNRGYVAK